MEVFDRLVEFSADLLERDRRVRAVVRELLGDCLRTRQEKGGGEGVGLINDRLLRIDEGLLRLICVCPCPSRVVLDLNFYLFDFIIYYSIIFICFFL